MKNYLKLFLTIVFFAYVFNTAQTEIPKNMTQAHDFVWRVIRFDAYGKIIGLGTAFAIGKDRFVTNFHVISGVINEISDSNEGGVLLEKGDQILELSEVIRVSAVEDLVIFTTKEQVTKYLKLSESQKDPSGRLFTLGYPQGIKQTLISSGKLVMIDNGHEYEIVVDKTNLRGISGSPVLNWLQKLVGIAYHTSDNVVTVKKVSKLEELQEGLIGLDCSKLSLSLCIEKAIKDIKNRSEQGDIRAKYSLAQLYFNGLGVMKNIGEAVELLIQSVKRDHILSRITLASMYFQGEEVEQDYNKALELLLPVVNKDFVHAQSSVAVVYAKQGNIEQTVYWVHKAKESGHVEAKFLLGRMHEFGVGAKEDKQKALELYLETANQGHFKSLEQVALKQLTGDGLQKDTTEAITVLSELKAQGHELSQEGKEALDMQSISDCGKGFN